MNQNIKSIPYGIADYRRLRMDNMYYVDKTRFLPLIEAAPYYLFFIRPRRFGKSLWLSLMDYYYDINEKENFATLFGDTYIGQHPTPDCNTYLTLSFNFAAVDPSAEGLETSFNTNVQMLLHDFLVRYAAYFNEDDQQLIRSYPTAADQLRELFIQVARKDLKLYVLIDEYDNFANTILTSTGESAYHDLTHGAGFFRYFFNLLKSATSGRLGGLTRLFITGVSPLTMDDVTSGFNIGSNISLAPRFNELLGFTETEVHTMLTYYQQQGHLPLDVADCLDILRPWYNGYHFTQADAQSMFNSDAVLYFVNHVTHEGTAPSDMLDTNMRTDYNKLRHLITVDRQLNGNFSLLREIIAEGQTLSPVTVSFPAEQLLRHEHFASLLYYLGLLTFAGVQWGTPVLRIPNRTVQELLYGYLRDGFADVDVFRVNLHQLGTHLRKMAYLGEWRPVFDYLAQAIAEQTSVRDYLHGEKVIQGFILAYLNIINHYLIWSERELGDGFVDIYLEPFLARYPDMAYGYLIELKYLPRSDKLTAAQLESQIAEKAAAAEAQLRRYRTDARLQRLGEHVTLKSLILIYHGWELVYQEELEPVSPPTS